MLKTSLRFSLLVVFFGLLPALANAQDRVFKVNLVGYEEVPAISSPGAGSFTLTINASEAEFSYQLTYGTLQGLITQSHIHFGQKGVNGGIFTFLCTNLGNGPAGTQNCAPSGTISGVIRAADIISGASAQGISAGEFAEVLKAIRAGSAYVNIHSDLFPGGEIRAQILPDPKIIK